MSTRYVIGISGFAYKHWRGVFYPADVPQKRWLEYYSTRFPTVEVNDTFCRLPKTETVQAWHDRVPVGFHREEKANRPITHYQRLENVEEPLDLFLQRVEILRDKLGPVLYQIPPSLRKDTELLQQFLAVLPHGFQHVIEFRHPSWYGHDVFEMLDKRNVAPCVHDMKSVEPPLQATAEIAYVRFHGTEGRYPGGHSDRHLQDWAGRIRAMTDDGLSCAYIFFNNDIGGHAVLNARTMAEILHRSA